MAGVLEDEDFSVDDAAAYTEALLQAETEHRKRQKIEHRAPSEYPGGHSDTNETLASNAEDTEGRLHPLRVEFGYPARNSIRDPEKNGKTGFEGSTKCLHNFPCFSSLQPLKFTR